MAFLDEMINSYTACKGNEISEWFWREALCWSGGSSSLEYMARISLPADFWSLLATTLLLTESALGPCPIPGWGDAHVQTHYHINLERTGRMFGGKWEKRIRKTKTDPWRPPVPWFSRASDAAEGKAWGAGRGAGQSGRRLAPPPSSRQGCPRILDLTFIIYQVRLSPPPRVVNIR